METIQDIENLQVLWEKLITSGVDLGKRILAATIIYIVGYFLIKLINRILEKSMSRRTFDQEVRTFLNSAIRIGLNVLLIIAVIGALGVETTSFAALLASAGVAIGMALSGQMQNLAGGVLILLQRPYHIGDFIVTNGTEGTVLSIQIFTTKLLTPDQKEVTVPNGIIAADVLTNISAHPVRRIDFSIGVEYDEDMDRVREVLMQVVGRDKQILQDPAPMVAVESLSDSCVKVKLRIFVKNENYWDAYFHTQEAVYKEFNAQGIKFPFPQITVHQA